MIYGFEVFFGVISIIMKCGCEVWDGNLMIEVGSCEYECIVGLIFGVVDCFDYSVLVLDLSIDMVF